LIKIILENLYPIGGRKINTNMENKEYYKKLFPLLTDYELIPNSESEEYNCISHTLNINNDISWP
jgi:hypothetical protein